MTLIDAANHIIEAAKSLPQGLAPSAVMYALPRAHRKTLAALEARGRIVRTLDKVLGTDGFGPVAIPQYQVPINLHVQWCEWCAENVTIEATP